MEELEKLEQQLRETSSPEALKTRILEIAKVNNPRVMAVIDGRAEACANCSYMSRLGLRCSKSTCSEQFAKGFPFIENKLCNMAFNCPLNFW